MHYETILYEVGANHVATITINRPDALNSFTAQMLRDFEHVWSVIRQDAHVRAVVLRGAEGRAFSTGADIKAEKDENVLGSDRLWDMVDPGERLGPRSNRVWKPVISAVHGLCCGGAFYWLNESDIIIRSDDAQFFDPHVSYGKVSAVEPTGQSYRMPLGEVLRIALLGNDERMSAQTALRTGLVSEVTSKENLWRRAHELAEKIAGKPPAAVEGTIRAIWESLDVPRSAAITQSFKYCLLGNPLGQAELDEFALLKQEKVFEVR